MGPAQQDLYKHRATQLFPYHLMIWGAFTSVPSIDCLKFRLRLVPGGVAMSSFLRSNCVEKS
jgi:hypothetical protein